MKAVALYHLIGGQNLPNLIAARHIQASRHVLFFTEETRPQMEQLREVLADVQCTPIKIDAWDYHKILRSIDRAIFKHQKNTEHILNFTGGNKLMALAADIVFRRLNFKRIYVNSERSEIIEFLGNSQEAKPIAVRLSVAEYLTVNGFNFTVREKNIPKEEWQNRLELAKFLSKPNREIDAFRLAVNKYIEDPKKWQKTLRDNKNYFEFPSKGNENQYRNCKILYHESRKEAVIKIAGQKFTLRGHDAVEYFAGGFWLEDLFRVEKIEGKNFFDEVKFNVIVKQPAPEAEQAAAVMELDMVATKNERLYVFELKSGVLRQEAVNRALAVKKLLGKYVKVYIIYRKRPALSGQLLQAKLKKLDIHALPYEKFSLDAAKIQNNLNL